MTSAPDLHHANRLIRKLEVLAPLTHAERQAILRLPIRVHDVALRQDIARDGDRPTHCCLVLSGWVCRYKLLKDGKRQILSFHVAGDIPDLGCLHIPVMDHSLASVKRATVGYIAHESLRALSVECPRVGSLLWRDTLTDACVLRAWIVGMGRRSALERIAHLFCEMYLKSHVVGLADDHRCAFPVTQTDLADALGLTTIHTNRVLQDMRRRFLITLSRSTLVIEAWDELRRVSEFDPSYLHLGDDEADVRAVA